MLHKIDARILDLWKRTNYNDILWPFFTNELVRSLELRIDGEVLQEFGTFAPQGDVVGMLGSYFERHATNVRLWIDGDILIFDKDEITENVHRSYVHMPRAFVRLMYGIFTASALLLSMACLCFVLRLVYDSELLDTLLVFSLFCFLANAVIGIGSILCNCHRMQRDPQVLASMPTIHFIEIL